MCGMRYGPVCGMRYALDGGGSREGRVGPPRSGGRFLPSEERGREVGGQLQRHPYAVDWRWGVERRSRVSPTQWGKVPARRRTRRFGVWQVVASERRCSHQSGWGGRGPTPAACTCGRSAICAVRFALWPCRPRGAYRKPHTASRRISSRRPPSRRCSRGCGSGPPGRRRLELQPVPATRRRAPGPPGLPRRPVALRVRDRGRPS